MNYKILSALLLTALFTSCDWAKDKAKDTVHKTGEIVAKTGSEFADGVAEGVEESFENRVSISDSLRQMGIETGKLKVTGTDSTTDNIFTAYFIFNKDFDGIITSRVVDEQGKESGRAAVTVKARQGEARYVDFVFDKRTNIDRTDKILVQ